MESIGKRQWVKDLRLAFVFIIIGAIALTITQLWLEPSYEKSKEDIASASSLVRQINATQAEADLAVQELNASGKVYGDLLREKDAYIEFVGGLAQENQLNINKMTVDDIESVGTLYSMKARIELQGSLYNVKNFVQGLYDAETISRINSLSYRLQAEDGQETFPWMWRSIDDEQLVPWWSLDIGKDIVQKDEGEDERPLSANDILRHGKALCYLEIEFIGSGG